MNDFTTHNYEITHLMGVELPAPLCYQLSPIISSYREHDQPPTHKDLDSCDKKSSESLLSKDNIIDTYKSIKYNQDLNWLSEKRRYNSKWKGFRTWYYE